MYQHHLDTIEKVKQKYIDREEIQALVVGGSVAHGFAREDSDVDIMLVVTAEEYKRRDASGALTVYDKESATYEAGYVDGKYITLDFLREVARHGSEPARFAFQGAMIAFSKIPELEAMLVAAGSYPKAGKEARIKSFYAQFEAWHWYCGEAAKRKDPYLTPYAAVNYVLFAGRLILALNETLYPYHKWFLRVLAGAERKPAGFMDLLAAVLERHESADIESLYKTVIEFGGWQDMAKGWPHRFLVDTELAWMRGQAPVADW